MEKTYSFVKNVRGSLAIDLYTFDMSIKRQFSIPYNISKVVVPYNFALGLFVSPEALNMLSMGFFTVEDFDTLVKEAIEKGLCASEDYPQIASLIQVEQMILTNNTVKIKKLLANKNAVEIGNLINFAREHYGKLNQTNKNLIEQECGVELEVE